MMSAWITPYVVQAFWRVVQAVLILWGLVVIGAYMSLIERRVLGLWQDRYGPNRVGPFGMGQLIADMIKIFFKEDWIPPFADRFLFVIAPPIAMGTALLAFMVVPLTPSLGVADLDSGVLFFMAMGGLGVYATLLGGYASANKYALLGMVRAAAQTLSYEVFFGLSMMGVVARAGSFNLRTIVLSQQGLWNIGPQFLGFVTFLIAGIAVIHRHPFDQPEAEQELADGFHIEYGGLKWGMFFVGEYVGITMISAMVVTLFFGGWLGPFAFIPPFLWFALKTFIFMMVFILLRASLPRPRYDRVMRFSWTVCLPITLINLLVTAFVLLWQGGAA